jgi:hypothetical protein
MNRFVKRSFRLRILAPVIASASALVLLLTVAVGSFGAQPASATGAPVVTAVSLDSGTTAGGTTVNVTGTGFTGATAVDFGSTPGTDVVVNSDTSVTVTSPAEPAWSTDVTVTTGAGTSATSSADTYTFTAAAPTTPGVPHVMEIMMENEAYSDLIGSTQAPNINKLTQTYALLTQSYAIGHPSEPNYLELISGSNYGVTVDNTPTQANIPSSAQTLANQFESAGITWRAYAESMPSAGYTGGDTDPDPYSGYYYLQHHVPWVYFPAVTGLSDFAQNVVPLISPNAVQSDLNASGAPDYVWVTPNAVDDMHDGPAMSDTSTVPTVGDAWLANFIAYVQSTSWYGAGGQIIVTWDEGLDSDTTGVGTAGEGGGGHILTLVISANLAASPVQYATPFNTAGILHSVEATYALPYLVDAADAGNGNINTLLGLAAPQFSADTATSSGTVGSSYSYNFVATGDPAPTFSITSGAPPPGLTLNANTGVLSGSPTTASTAPYTFVISASNDIGTVAGAQQSILVSATGGGGGGPTTTTSTTTTSTTSTTTTTVAMEPLTITTRSGKVGTTLTLSTSGGFIGGTVVFVVTNGTAKGCAVAGNSLHVTSAGTCIVIANEAADSSHTGSSSAATAVTFAKVVAYHGRIVVSFGAKSVTLGAAAKSQLLALVKKLVAGDTVSCTGYAKNNRARARARAVVVAHFLSSRIKVHLVLKTVIDHGTNRTTVTTS